MSASFFDIWLVCFVFNLTVCAIKLPYWKLRFDAWHFAMSAIPYLNLFVAVMWAVTLISELYHLLVWHVKPISEKDDGYSEFTEKDPDL